MNASSFISISLFVTSLIMQNPVAAQQVDSPIAQIGDNWTYETLDDWTGQTTRDEHLEIIGSMGEFNRVRIDGRVKNPRNKLLEPRQTEELTFRADLNFDFPAKDGTIQRRQNFQWPLDVGKKWTYEYGTTTVVNNQSVILLYRMSAQVVGWERVMTPAGSFRAIKIAHQGTIEFPSASASNRLGWTFWYSPEAKRHVKYTYQSETSTGSPDVRYTSILTHYKLSAP